MALMVLASGCASRRTDAIPPFDLANRVQSIGGWRYIRHPSLDRSIWFCVNREECSWEHLGKLTGLDPLEYQRWVRGIKGNHVLEAAPKLGERYTIPNRVYTVMGDASLNLIPLVDSIGIPANWLLDYPEALWSLGTRPLGAMYAFHPDAPRSEGYKVTAIQNATAVELVGIFNSADTYGMLYFGHGGEKGITTFKWVHGGEMNIGILRYFQNHRFGRVVLNSCYSASLAERIAGPTAVWRGHAGALHPLFGYERW